MLSIRSCLLFLLIFSSTSPSLANVKIGNGGEGLVIDGQLRLRDFVTSDGRYVAPVVAPIEVVSGPEAIFPLPGMEFDVGLLMRVVSHVRTASPIVAEAILETAKGCWIVVDGDLWLPNPRDTSGGRHITRIPIAVRGFPFLSCTSVNKHTWRRLSEVDKIGLIVHEAISSMLKPTCSQDWCGQDAVAIRYFVSELFYAHHNRLQKLVQGWLRQLGFENYKNERSFGAERIVAFTANGNERVEVFAATDPISIGPLIAAHVHQLCLYAERTSIEVEVTRPARCLFKNVVSSGGQRQIVTRPGRRRAFKTIHLRQQPFTQCASQLSERLELWFGVAVPGVRECY